MFDNVVSTGTSAISSFTVVYRPGAYFNSIALINLDAKIVKVTIREGLAGPIVYEITVGLIGTESFSWYDYFFNDVLFNRTQVVLQSIPATTDGHITIEVIGETGSQVSLGYCIAGDLTALGNLQYGAKSGIIDYSVKNTDEFGTITFVERPFSKRISGTFTLNNSDFNRVHRYLYALRATPVVWLASDNPQYEEAFAVYGFYRDFSVDISYPTFSLCSIEIESLI